MYPFNVTVNVSYPPDPPPPPPPPPRDNNTLTPAVAIDTRPPGVVNIYTGKPAGNYTVGDLITIVAELSRPVAFSELPSRYSEVSSAPPPSPSPSPPPFPPSAPPIPFQLPHPSLLPPPLSLLTFSLPPALLHLRLFRVCARLSIVAQ